MILNMGGGAPLNFRVVGGTTQPANPAENTIWVNTDAPVTGWVFDINQPDDTAEGTVWLNIVQSSSATINALRKNQIILSVGSAFVYSNGAWSSVACALYQHGEWKTTGIFLYDYGKQDFRWNARGWKWSDASHAERIPSITVDEDGSATISVSATAGVGGGVYELVEDFDLTHVTNLTLTYDFARTTNGAVGMFLIVVPRNATYLDTGAVAKMTSATTGSGLVMKLDASAITGSYDICVGSSINTFSQGTGSAITTMKTLEAT